MEGAQLNLRFSQFWQNLRKIREIAKFVKIVKLECERSWGWPQLDLQFLKNLLKQEKSQNLLKLENSSVGRDGGGLTKSAIFAMLAKLAKNSGWPRSFRCSVKTRP